MAVHNWIDEFIKQIEEIGDGGRRTVKAYRVYEENELPEKLEPKHFPCAITSIELTVGDYSAGGSWELTYGTTEFHLFGDAARQHYGECLEWIPRIRNKFHEKIMLGGLVDSIALLKGAGEGAGIRGPVELQYGDEVPHWGLVATWVAKENVSTEVTVGA